MAVLLSAAPARAQFPEGGGLYNQELLKVEASMDNLLQNHPDLEDMFFPLKYSIPVDFYRDEAPDGYFQNVIFNPCQNQRFDCCKDVYGTPEFMAQIGDVDILLKASGEVLEPHTRWVARVCT